MITKEQGLANLGPEDVARRQKAEKLWTAAQTAPEWPPEIEDKVRLISQERQKAKDALEEKHAAEMSALENEFDEKVKAVSGDLDSPRRLARSEWLEFEEFGSIVEVYDDDEGWVPQRCAITGLVIDESDSILEDGAAGKVYLKKALGIPEEPQFEPDDDEGSDQLPLA